MRRCPVQHVEGGDDHQGEEQRVVVEDGECGCLILGNLGENWMLIKLKSARYDSKSWTVNARAVESDFRKSNKSRIPKSF